MSNERAVAIVMDLLLHGMSHGFVLHRPDPDFLRGALARPSRGVALVSESGEYKLHGTRFICGCTFALLLLSSYVLATHAHSQSIAQVSTTNLPYVVNVATDRRDGLYDLDETVTFVVQVSQGGRPAHDVAVYWELTNDGLETISTGVLRTQRGVAHITGKLDQPGFLRAQATVYGLTGTVNGSAAAGIAPHLIEPSMPAPDDFDAFWQEKKAALAAIPPVVRQTPVAYAAHGIEAWDVQIDSLGAPVSGYMARPQDAAPDSLPAIITLHGAGVHGASLNTAVNWAREGALAFDINAHGILNGQPSSYYTSLANGSLRQYWLQGRESREDYYFLEMFLRIIRAIDFLTEQPEWDGETVVLYGTSQGGAQAIAGAGLDERVTFFVAGVTGMADLTGTLVGRPMGWPNMATDLAYMTEADAGKVLDALRYFDGVNFLARTKADGFFTVGFLDPICRPTTVYAAYNVLQNEKAIYNDLFAVHENTPEATRRMREAVLTHMGK